MTTALKKPVFVAFALSLVVLLVSIFFAHHYRSYNSDDVSWQTILSDWKPFDGGHALLGSSDNFVDKIPFFALFEHIFPAGRKLLLLESWLTAAAGFTFFYFSCVYFLKKARARLDYPTLLPFVWMASFGYSFSELFLDPNWRGFEIGLSFVTFALIAMVLNKDIRPWGSAWPRVAAVLAAIVAGILIYSDPYYLYFTIGTSVLFVSALWFFKKIDKYRALGVYGCILLSLVFAKVAEWLATEAGVRMATTYPAKFVDFDKLGNNISQSVHGLAVIYGADFFGDKPASFKALVALINAAILVFIIYRVWTLQRSWRSPSEPGHTWTLFFGLMIPFVFVVYTLSTLDQLATYRYFIMLVLSSVLLLALTIGQIRGRLRVLACIVLALSAVLNLALSSQGNSGFLQLNDRLNVRNKLNYALIDTVEAHGLTKGYAGYWQSNINTYLSDNKVSFLPSICSQGKVLKDRWLVAEAAFDRPANRSFYLIDPGTDFPLTCTADQVISQLGTPQQTIKMAGKTILIYDYDISSKM